MILGPLGFRVNVFDIIEKPDHTIEYIMKSPLRTSVWYDNVLWSVCGKYNPCPMDSEGHVMIRKECTCGIYAAVCPLVACDYLYSPSAGLDKSVMLLVEGLDANTKKPYILDSNGKPIGSIWLSENTDRGVGGFTAPGALAVYLVKLPQKYLWSRMSEDERDRYDLLYACVSQRFGLPIITMSDAIMLVRQQWEGHGMTWYPFYEKMSHLY